ncbi:unnamed protein product [marine sediment metagenome]|uniref:Uncharacterized protein n=1 Tax=marine sediment metagenome TaxID=412755 RepID=X1C0S2_9ZZZZ
MESRRKNRNEIYATIRDKGYFHYNFKNHLLELITEDNLAHKLAQASWDQRFIEEAYLNVVICANYSRTTNWYRR